MKFLSILSILFLTTGPAFAAEVGKEELLQTALKAQLKCDASGEASAKMLNALLGLIFTAAAVDAETTPGFTKDGDAAMDHLISAKECQDFDKAYHEITGLVKKYIAKDLEEEMKAPQGQAELKELAKQILENAAAEK